MDVEALKQKILDLAIRGKLVPQDPNDEPASVLIEKIREEKNKLVKEGKIKASKEESYIYKGSDNCYYEKIGNKTIDINDEIPFEIPNSWIWVRLKTIISLKSGDCIKVTNLSKTQKYPVYGGNGINGTNDSFNVEPNTIIIGRVGVYCGSVYKTDTYAWVTDNALIVTPRIISINIDYLKIVLEAMNLGKTAKSTAQPVVSGQGLYPLLIPIPPLNEQSIISNKIYLCYELMKKISINYRKVLNLIEIAKRKILDEVFGENGSYKSYYEKNYVLGDILPYEQPGPYIVKNTDYSNSYDIPVVTPGKSFILGYTNEKDGIYHNQNKVIIFDDFTTASRLIDFDFKVKSSAMKILRISDNYKFDIDYMYYLLQTIYVNNDTHKRYWISEYAPIKLQIHKYEEQLKIVEYIKKAYGLLESINRF